MKKLLLLFSAILISLSGWSQAELSIVSPEGLTFPYEVSPGTEVTVQWYYFDEAPTGIFTHNEEPVFPGFGTDPAWTQNTGFTDNGDGTFNYSFNVNEPTWVWGGFYSSFIGQWSFSEVFAIGIASSVVISYEDGLVCPDGTGEEILSVEGTYDSYQWYKDNVIIDGATESTYAATEAGNYKLEATADGEALFSNLLTLTNVEIDIAGMYTQDAADMTITATGGFDSYQWMSGPDADNLSPVVLETNQSIVVSLTEDMVYYAAQGTVDGCTATSDARVVYADAFITPAITLNADSNEFGNVCLQTTINMAVEDNYGSYYWTQNGQNAWNDQPSHSISQSYQAGTFGIEVSPMGWPEITLVSETVDATFFEVAEPGLFVAEPGPYCPDTEVNIVLSDEGYEYVWYVHTEWTPTEDDIVVVEGTTLTLTFTEQIYVTVEANFEGCTSRNNTNLNAAADQTPYISLVDWQEGYMCTDSISEIQVPAWSVDDYTNFQWYEDVDGALEIIDGATEPIYPADATGFYTVTADLAACPDVNVSSNSVEIQSYLDREIYIYADDADLCVGEVTNLNISGLSDWQNLQWFEEDINIGSGGYEESFVPMIGAGTSSPQEVTEFNSYIVKGRHVSCPNGLKVSSNIIDIRPQVNPMITVDPNYGITSWKPAFAFDSIPTYIFCTDEPVTMSIPDEYNSYEWYREVYTGDDDYQLGSLIDNANTATVDASATGAEWFTAVVELDGCVGYSTPVLIDTWVFQTPAIASYGNNELCEEGDSALMHIAFAGNYEEIQWTLDGVIIEGADNDSIWGTEPGEYVVNIRREECPQFWLTSGVGPYLSFLNAEITENDTVIYALPQLGFYTYQWYLDGEPIDAPSITPALLYKDGMADGVYTVEVSNEEGCTSLSGEYIWDTTGIEELYDAQLVIYPNPANEQFQISGIDLAEIDALRIYDITGKEVDAQNSVQKTVKVDHLLPGIYFAELEFENGVKITRKIVVE